MARPRARGRARAAASRWLPLARRLDGDPRLSRRRRAAPSRRGGGGSAARRTRRMTAPATTSSPRSAARSASPANEATRRDIVAERLRRAPKGVIPARGQLAGADADRPVPHAGRSRFRHGRGGRVRRRRARARSPISCAATICRPACAWATIRGSAPCRGASTVARGRARPERRRRPQRGEPRLRRRRRDRHADHGLRARRTRRRSTSCPTTTSWSLVGQGHRAAITRPCGTGCAPPTAEGRCRAPST